MKRAAILQTGVNNPNLSAHYPDYPSMFRTLIGQAQATPMIELVSFPGIRGIVFPDIDNSMALLLLDQLQEFMRKQNG